MVSIAAQQVGKRVSECIRKGERPILGKLAIEVGYAKSSSERPSQITATKSYREVVDPIVKDMLKERKRVMMAMRRKRLKQVDYDKLSKVLDELTKNIQLLSGGKTANIGFSLKRLFDQSQND